MLANSFNGYQTIYRISCLKCLKCWPVQKAIMSNLFRRPAQINGQFYEVELVKPEIEHK